MGISILTGRATVAPQSLYCPIAHLHTSREAADAACAGVFTHAGETVKLGLPPNWRDPRLPSDEEWAIEWSKLYVGLDLGHAYTETGDPRYAEAWRTLVDSWIDQVPVGVDSSDVTARRVQNWIYAWDGFVRAGGTEHVGHTDRMLDSIAAQTRFIRENLTPARNHRTIELYALVVVALGLPQLDPDGELSEFAFDQLAQNLLTDMGEDGVHCERSTHYHLIALRSFVAARENARRAGIQLPRAYDERLAQACEFGIYCHRPDGGIAAFSDSDGGEHSDILLLAGRLLNRPDFVYAATGGASGCPPEAARASFPVGGYYVQRGGWGTGSVRFADVPYLMLDCGPLGEGGHGHYDLLSIEVAAGGRPLVVDPGRYTYAEEGERNWRQHFKGTGAHSTVCVDGLDQQRYRRGKPKGSQAAATLARQIGCDRLDVVFASAISPMYDAVHQRTVAFVNNEYWIVIDDLEAPSSHEYTVRFQLSEEAEGRTLQTGQTVLAPGVALAFHGAEPQVAGGWVAPTYGVRRAAPAATASMSGRRARFITAIVPRADDGGLLPTVRALDDDMAAVLSATPDGCTDIVAWGSVPTPRRIGALTCTADVLWARFSSKGRLLHAVVHGRPEGAAGTSLDWAIGADGWSSLQGETP